MIAVLVLMFFSLSDDSFDVGATLELLFNIRPRAQSGLLLHVGNSSRTPSGSAMGHFLTVYMLRGEVRLCFWLLLSKQSAVWIFEIPACRKKMKLIFDFVCLIADMLPIANFETVHDIVVVCRWWFVWTKEEENLWCQWNQKLLYVTETFIKFQVKLDESLDLTWYFYTLHMFNTTNLWNKRYNLFCWTTLGFRCSTTCHEFNEITTLKFISIWL